MNLWKNTNIQSKTIRFNTPIIDDDYFLCERWYKYRAEITNSYHMDRSFIVSHEILIVIHNHFAYFSRHSYEIERELTNNGFRINDRLEQFTKFLTYTLEDVNVSNINVFPSDICKHFVLQNSSRIKDRVEQWKKATV